MIYEGPYIANQICKGLLRRMAREKISSISKITGSASEIWAAKKLET